LPSIKATVYFIIFSLPLPFADGETIPSRLSSEINKGVCVRFGLFVFADNNIHSTAYYFELLLSVGLRDKRYGTTTKWKQEKMQVRFGDKNQRSHDFSNFMLLFMTTSLLCIAGANTCFCVNGEPIAA